MIGKLDRRILIEQQETPEADTFGQIHDEWTPYKKVWAQQDYKSGVENYQSNQQTNANFVFWTVRYDADVTTEMRIVHNSEVYSIHSIRPIDRYRYMEIKSEVEHA